MTNTEPILAFREVNLWYGKRQVIQDLDFEIMAKKITALIGPTGAGKTAFLRMLNRMNELDGIITQSGIIEFQGTSLFDYPLPILRRKMGMVFSEPNPLAKSIYANVAFGLELQGLRGKKVVGEVVEVTLRRVGLWDEVKDYLKDPALGLELGQQQLLCLARTLAVNPDVLLLDDPCAKLDARATTRLENVIEDLKENYTIIIATDNWRQGARVSDYTAFFLAGRLIEANLTEKLFQNPQDSRTEDFITGRGDF